ncbi:hypothetical protein EWM64_g3213 [Hericium alpestre]|uniref:AMP-dependent synthetase/ligase domain-containing protein n=1 Tax=Hericium alpestre TaxID=135208 RepID=A0A4Z0A2W2_9AGAM|nr:hypothetical protein EWM64_g3213 [Hericium alpestre]
MTIYTSPYAPVRPPSCSVYTFHFSLTHPGSQYWKHPPSAPAFTSAPTGNTLTRAQLRSLTLQLFHGLKHPPPSIRGRLVPFARGDVVLVFSPNSLAWPVVLFGLLAGGACLTLANPAYTPAELAHQYTDSGAGLVFVHPNLLDSVLEMLKLVGVTGEHARRRIVVMQYEPGEAAERKGSGKDLVWLEDLLGLGEEKEEEKFEGDGPDGVNATAFLCYSSGTTGKPKGVMTTHKNMVAVNLMLFAAFSEMDPSKDVWMAMLPFYHMYATAQYDLTSLHYITCGAAPIGSQLLFAAKEKLASVGAHVVIGQAYGLTETSPHTHQLPRESAMRKVGSVGLLIPNLEARLVLDDDDGDEGVDAPEWDDTEEALGGPGVRMSARGELWLRGPTIMKGYLNNPAATRNAITPAGWFKTGDICIRDEEGFWYIVDRKKELIKYKGLQVAPAELEALLLTHPQLVDAAVIGVDDPVQATELPRAFVVPASPPSSLAKFAQEIQDWMASRVANHKKLRGGVVIVDHIPKSPSGKILRRQLRDRVKAVTEASRPVRAKL